jgi:hypothetical protein
LKINILTVLQILIAYRFNSNNEFPGMMSNSALMQSYNLMKMSSEVTNKNQNAPSFVSPQNPKMNELYQPRSVPEYNRSKTLSNMRQPAAPQNQDQNENNFLGNLANLIL